VGLAAGIGLEAAGLLTSLPQLTTAKEETTIRLCIILFFMFLILL
jgi:hypothetical protein